MLGAAASLTAAFAALTLVALEGHEVVLLRTIDGAGRPRDTRAWIADDAGALWVEAANPERAFLQDLRARPVLALHRAGIPRPCRAEIVWGEEGHRHIRRLLAARYGWADTWVGFLADTSHSVAVRLECDARAR